MKIRVNFRSNNKNKVGLVLDKVAFEDIRVFEFKVKTTEGEEVIKKSQINMYWNE
jgi:hypothetical protein